MPGTGRNPLARLLPDADVETAVRGATRRGSRLLAWLAVLASPLLTVGGLAVFQPAGAPPTRDGGAPAPSAMPAGWAEMYVRAWLSATRDDSAGLEVFYPAATKSQRAPGTQVPVDTATVSAVSPVGGQWSVVVVADVLQLQPDGKRRATTMCAQVTMVGAEDAYVAAALPSPVACPGTGPAVALGYNEVADPGGPISQSVAGFLGAYLTGQGQLDRLISPGARLAPPHPAPFTDVRVVELRTRERFEPGQAARPPDGTAVSVFAHALAFDVIAQSTPVDYALTLLARAGRWEVKEIDPGPQLAGR
ncbi:Conjugative transposon protein TcpC [Amycolatopsis pretoriensis]|uniref:Conjugative transposon protein TcpC n=1 Tax=Amycolatopsis pretoriensis TaxID=218821 RepID=A0A1H5RFH8_9PSEU|nr:conjugal transfer protein [Amycolatopsis pretoriensis]SEF37110.1 Conjugative transposon protein TcpC [Amycolatopsis pretoriensis]